MNYVIMPSSDAMLCNDNHFRVRPWFGTYSSCVKVYKTQGHALRAANKFARRGGKSIFVASVNSKRMLPTDEFYFRADGTVEWNNKTSTVKQLIDEQQNGIDNGFPVTFTKVC